MQDHRHPIFLIATANNLAQLPPELMRKGRFDEIFFIDLPGAEEREVIFSIHLRKRRRDKAGFDLPRLVAAAEGFSGAEIEQAVIAGLYAAFAEKAECTTEHVLAAIAGDATPFGRHAGAGRAAADLGQGPLRDGRLVRRNACDTSPSCNAMERLSEALACASG